MYIIFVKIIEATRQVLGLSSTYVNAGSFCRENLLVMRLEPRVQVGAYRVWASSMCGCAVTSGGCPRPVVLVFVWFS
jgi:hypothetical protein